MPRPVLVVHGGAGAWPVGLLPRAVDGVRAALDVGWRALRLGGSALDAVEAAVAAMEDDRTFNAGTGSCLTADGRVQLDALIMDGASLEAGAVACVERLTNPIHAARRFLAGSPHVLFAGPDAERQAETLGEALCDPQQLVSAGWLERRPAQDTVGAVALDERGHLAAATSTGGTPAKAAGRVGGSPLVGCGGYADDEAGAASATGWGEAIMKLVLSKWAVDRLRAGLLPDRAASLAIDYLERRLNGSGGIILLDRDGRWGAAANTAAMPWGVRTPDVFLVEELQRELA